MTPSSRRIRNRAGVLAMVVALLGAVSCAAPSLDRSTTVEVLAVAEGAEAEQFKKMLEAFTAKTGFRHSYRGTRALDQVLLSDVRNGTPPDVAVLPSSAKLAEYAALGALYPLDPVVDMPQFEQEYRENWVRLVRLTVAPGPARLYGIVVKASLKSLVWYRPSAFNQTPLKPSWDELTSMSGQLARSGSRPWCLGMAAAPVSGWPGTDWIEDILLHQSGVDSYQQWATGELPWTSGPVRQAWQTWGGITAIGYGGPATALLTTYAEASRPMFAEPPGCHLEHQASFVINDYRQRQQTGGRSDRGGVDDFNYFRFPAINPAVGDVREVSADLAGMFRDTPAARALIRYLASAEAQRIWPGNGPVFSANRAVDPKLHRNQVEESIARALISDSTLCFDASDLMPEAMSTAFSQAVLEFLDNPGRLEEILRELEQLRGQIKGQTPQRPGGTGLTACGSAR